LKFFANKQEICNIKDSDAKIEIYKVIIKFATSLPNIESLIKNPEIKLTLDDIEKFLLEQKENLLDIGVAVILPKELQELIKPKLSIKAKAKSKNFKSFLSIDKMVEYGFDIKIGDDVIDAKELQKLLKEGKRVVKFKENFVYLDEREISKLFKQIEKQKKLSKFELLHKSFNNEIELDASIKEYFESIFEQKRLTLPPINANLREY